MRRNVSLLLVALMLVPTAAAWPWDDVVIQVPAFRVGDAFRSEERWTSFVDGEPVARHNENILVIEDRGLTLDSFGVERSATRVSTSTRDSAGVEFAVRCHLLDGGEECVRSDVLTGQWSNVQSSSYSNRVGAVDLGSGVNQLNITYTTTFGASTMGLPVRLADRTIAEGDRLHLDIFGRGGPNDEDKESSPAEPTNFKGRKALAFAFDLAPADADFAGKLTVILADGLPGFVQGWIDHKREGRDETFHDTFELTGYASGNGPALPAFVGTVLPERSPIASFSSTPKLAFDDAGWALPFTYAEAFEAARTDPQVGLAAWLRAHPEARLHSASYFRHGFGDESPTGETDGGWGVYFQDGESNYWVSVTRYAPPAALSALAPANAVTQKVRYVHTIDHGADSITWLPDEMPAFPEEVASSADLAALGRGEGVPPERVESISYGFWGQSSYVILHTINPLGSNSRTSEKGEVVQMDAARGGLVALADSKRDTDSSSILNPFTNGNGDLPKGETVSALRALAGPAFGAGLAGGAALTGLALLVVAVKFLLIPLFTRLRRDRLLDNPVRARLYERIRSEPGIHRAELVDYGGIGEGATRHHLDQLAKNHLLVEMKEAGFVEGVTTPETGRARRHGRVRYYAAGEVPPEIARRESALRAGSARAVYDLLASEPHLSLREAGARLGMSAPSVHKAKKKLEKAGLLPAAHVTAAQVAEA